MRTVLRSALGLLILVMAGCAETPAVRRVAVPGPENRDVRRMEYDRTLPLPEQSSGRELPAPPFDDAPLVNQRVPEQSRFEAAYRGVGKPRMVVFVNRNLAGYQLGPDGRGEAERRTEERRVERGGEMGPPSRTVETHRQVDVHGPYVRDRYDRVEREGPPTSENTVRREEMTRAEFRGTNFDEVMAKSTDYEAMEAILTDTLACQGAVEIVSPTLVRQKLTEEQLKDLQSEQPRMLNEIAKQLDADVVVMVGARPTRQTARGVEVRLVGEAMNTKGGQQIARAMVDVPPPLEKQTLNKYTRWVARKMMMDMTQTWSGAEAAPGNPGGGPQTRP